MQLLVHESTGNFSVWHTPPRPRRGFLIIDPDPDMLAKLAEGKPLRWQPVEGNDLGELVAIPTVQRVPPSIRAWQAKAMLATTPHPGGGTMLEAAEAAIAAMPDGIEKTTIQSAWTHNADFHRTAPGLVAMATAMGLDDEQLNTLFIAAAGLSV